MKDYHLFTLLPTVDVMQLQNKQVRNVLISNLTVAELVIIADTCIPERTPKFGLISKAIFALEYIIVFKVN